MKIYLDKNFVRNYFTIQEDNKGVFSHFRKVVLQQYESYELVTNYASLEEIGTQKEDLLFFEMLFEGIPNIEFTPFNVDYDFVWRASNEGGFILFLTEQTTEEEEKWSKLRGYEFISHNTIIHKWAKYSNYESLEWSLLNPNSLDPELCFKDYSQLSFLKKFPLNSIVIVDNFILGSKRKIKENLLSILDSLLINTIGKKISIIIVSKDRNILSGEIPSVQDKLKEAHAYIETSVQSKFPGLQIDLGIIKYNKSFGIDIHDRRIYTNYMVISATAGFEVYRNNKRVYNDSDIKSESVFKRFRRKTSIVQLANIVAFFKKAQNYPDYYYPNNISSPLLKL